MDDAGAVIPPALSWWRDFGGRFAAALCATQNRGRKRHRDPAACSRSSGAVAAGGYPANHDGSRIPLRRRSCLSVAAPWGRLSTPSLPKPGCPLQEFLKRRNSAWNLVGRVHFNLAENRRDPEAPFAFLATYTPRLSAQAKAQHLPLGEALKEYAGAANKDRLLSLLTPVQTAAASCPWLKAMVDEGEIYYPLRWTAAEALQFLTMFQHWKAPAWWCARLRAGA